MSTVLVTGGTGYIGSHTTLALHQAGYQTVILDNLCNSSIESIDAIEKISGTRPIFIKGDIRDANLLRKIFADHSFIAVMHFAGLKAVGESTQIPLDYYDNNIHGSVTLLKAMQCVGLRTFIFSSSATVYGQPKELPLTEEHPCSATNPYGHTKLVLEEVLENLHRSESNWRIARLRYFNPAGAHPSGLIGESPRGTPNNLIPYIAQVATKKRSHVQVFGADYDTADSTGVRDYIHILDLAQGHIAALKYCLQQQQNLLTANLGTGIGYSVLDVIKAYEKASGQEIPYQCTARRPGDIAACWANPAFALSTLGWKTNYSLDDMCKDDWRWAKNNTS